MKFTPPGIKSQRLAALDLARVFAMLMMIQGHTIYAIADPSGYDTIVFPWSVWHFIRGLTAPVFLFVSGAVHVFANKRLEDGTISRDTTKKRIRTALVLIAIGYMLVFPAAKIYDLPFIEYRYWLSFFKVNILQLFGVSLLIALVFFKITRNSKTLGFYAFTASMSIVFLSPVILNIDWFSYIPEIFAAYLSYEKGTLFSIFPYTGFLLLGVGFGTILQRIEQEKRLNFLRFYTVPIGLALLGLGYSVGTAFPAVDYHMFDYPIDNPGNFFVRTGLVFIIISIVSNFYSVTKGLAPYYTMFGKRALVIYVVHLVIIYGTSAFPGLATLNPKTLPVLDAIPIAICVQLLSLGVTFIIDYTLSQNFGSRTFYKYLITSYLIYLLFL